MKQSPQARMGLAESFQKRRRIAAWFALPWIAVGLTGFLFAAFLGEEHTAREVVFLAAFAITVIGALVGVRLYRCPACDKVPSEDGILLNPKTCPWCGVRLK